MKENMSRTKTVAMQHCEGNIATAVVPFDDSRVVLKSDPDAYINASFYKVFTTLQLIEIKSKIFRIL